MTSDQNHVPPTRHAVAQRRRKPPGEAGSAAGAPVELLPDTPWEENEHGLWCPASREEKFTNCGYLRRDHHYNGTCYGLCGEFVAAPVVNSQAGESPTLGASIDLLIGLSFKRVETLNPDAKHRYYRECGCCGGTDENRDHYKPDIGKVEHTSTCPLAHDLSILRRIGLASDAAYRERPSPAPGVSSQAGHTHKPGECAPLSGLLCRRYYPGYSACQQFGGNQKCLLDLREAALSDASPAPGGMGDLAHSELAAYFEKQCNHYTNGQCMTLRCQRRGYNYQRGAIPDYARASCEEHEAAVLIRTAAQSAEMRERTIEALGQITKLNPHTLGNKGCRCTICEMRDIAEAAIFAHIHSLAQAGGKL